MLAITVLVVSVEGISGWAVAFFAKMTNIFTTGVVIYATILYLAAKVAQMTLFAKHVILNITLMPIHPNA